MLIMRTGNGNSSRMKHHRNSRRQKYPKPIEIIRDYETMKQGELAREIAFKAYNERRLDMFQNGIIDTAEASVKQKISIWRAAFNRAYDKMNTKINDLLQQVKESDKQAQIMNKGFYKQISSLNTNFYSDLQAMSKESEKRNVGFMKKAQTQKFMKDLNTLTRENEKRNTGFYCRKLQKGQASKLKKMCEESYKRNDIYMERKKHTDMDRMNNINDERTASFMVKRPDSKYDDVMSMNDRRTAQFMVKRPDSKYDAVMSMNDRRTAGFISKKPLTKLDAITKWNDQRNAVFRLHA